MSGSDRHDEVRPTMDQRYDPAFQRGHTAERPRPVAIENSRRSHLASLEEIAPQLIEPPRDAPVRPPVDDRFDRGHDGGYDGGPRARVQPYEQRTTSVDARIGDAPAPANTLSEAPEGFDGADPLPPRRNSWEHALWVIGVVLTVGGIVLTWQATNNSFRGWNSSDGPETGYILMQTVYAIAPGFITVGLATIVALIFRRMLDHDRRSRS
ncbi:hypothetical protein KXS11_07325 [Plantibacter flavus]|uniref:hypothetical protein n=1 Tax=Plantibacter flavus TaxID=150123 RepID=UPI003F150750